MDTRVENGDQVFSPGGVPMWVDGADSWRQRAMLRLQAEQGAFCYDRAFGGSMATLTNDHSEEEWLAATREALLPEPGLDVISAVQGDGICVLTLETPEGQVQLGFLIKEE